MKQFRRWWREYNVEIIGSLILHGGLAMLLANSKGCMPEITQPKPVTKINVVSLGSIKRSKVPDRASRKERSSAPKPIASKSTPKSDAPKPPPPKTDQMTVPKESPKKEEPKKETPKPKKEDPKKEDPQKSPPKEEPKKSEPPKKDTREELIRKAQREQLLKSLQNAPVGPTDREATSQEGTDKTLPGLPSAEPSDPILAQYISQARDKIIPNWAPLPTLVEAHPEYEVIIEVEVLADGTLKNPTVVKKSGDASFDAAAIRAIYKTVSLPPPPEKWKASAAQGILITLAAADKT